jgi:hypothetical protein
MSRNNFLDESQGYYWEDSCDWGQSQSVSGPTRMCWGDERLEKVIKSNGIQQFFRKIQKTKRLIIKSRISRKASSGTRKWKP